MAEVNEEIVRVFFKSCGFMVRTNVRYWFPGGGVGGDSDIDLVVHNLEPDKKNPPHEFVLDVGSLRGIEYAAVEVKGWHTENFSPSTIKHTPRLLNFVRKEAVQAATEALNTAHFSKILVVSHLSPAEPYRSEAIRLLRGGGVDHVIEFPTILNHIVAHTLPNKDYRESEMLQTVRLLKNYGFLEARQPENGEVV